MRKLILIAVIATMSSSACHANLSLASNDTPQEAVEQPSLRAIEARAEVKGEVKAEAQATAVKSPTVSKPKPRHQSGRTFVFHRSYRHCL